MTSAGMFEKKSLTKSQRVRLKGGAAVDPDSGLEDDAHVYRQNGDPLNAVLCNVDAASGLNSFYRLQLLQSDYGNRSAIGGDCCLLSVSQDLTGLWTGWPVKM